MLTQPDPDTGNGKLRRFFIQPEAITGSNAIISGPEAHHLTSVLRLRPGARISLADGTGAVYQAEILKSARDRVEVTILSSERASHAGPRLHLGQALLKGKKMDLLIEKASEMGIEAIHPFVSRYCEVQNADNRESRWERIALAACKQCGRPVPLTIQPTADLSSLLAASEAWDTKIIFWEHEECHSIEEVFIGKTPLSVMILIGSEGGFEQKEIDQAVIAGYQPVTLGNRILRAETASLAAMAIMQYLLGNLDRLAQQPSSTNNPYKIK